MTETPDQPSAGTPRLTSWAIDSRVAYVDLGDRVVVLALASEAAMPIALSGTASSIWRAVDGGQSTAEVTAEVAAEYDKTVAEVAAHVAGFLDELADKGYLHRRV